MNIDITHKHAGHIVIIEGHPFKSNNAGKWDLIEIWKALKLDANKSPSQWRTKEAQRLVTLQFLHSKQGRLGGTWATKRAVIEYAAWVSPEFKDTVFDAFEAILESPEVARVVAKIMHDSGRLHSSSILERMLNENQERNQILRSLNRGRTLSREQKERRKVSRQFRAEAKRQRNAGQQYY
ncbi:KilA-N domain-containing protein [Pseudomonas citri]|uniref:KilA-N domain-containing protein n=1 Tax=Pseudomonas citri TaxID=2978349 RepID=UPI0021B5D99D|nr:KilA-N domain-containing protein [Pseudomonas citri]